MHFLVRLVVISSIVLVARCIKRTSTYIENTDVEDLETSASAYSYQASSGGPSYYSELEGNPDDLESIGRYSNHPVPLHMLPLSPNFLPGYDSKYIDSYGEMLAPYAKGFDNFQDGIADSSHHQGGQSTKFIKGGGSNYEDGERASGGEKGEKGYSNRDEYEKGLRARHQNDHTKGFYDVRGGDKRAREEQDGHYEVKHRSGNTNNGGSFSDEKSHDKGSKTSGYHKVYHKDEYKKNKSFYDNKDQKGHFNRHGNFNSNESADSGATSSGKSLDAGYRAGRFGAGGHKEQGKFLEEVAGHKAANGDAKYSRNNSAYVNQAGKSSNNNHGYSEESNDEK